MGRKKVKAFDRPVDRKSGSPVGGNRGCLCKDNTYSKECCNGSLMAQGIGNIYGSSE